MTIAQVWYSASVHVVILISISVSLWLVIKKSMTDPSFTLVAHGSTVFYFGICFLIYFILRIYEAKPDINLKIRKFVAHLSHLTGGLAALFLIYVLSPMSAACLAPLWLVWLAALVSITFAKLMFPQDGNSGSRLPI